MARLERWSVLATANTQLRGPPVFRKQPVRRRWFTDRKPCHPRDWVPENGGRLHSYWETAGVVFVADDLGAWLVGLLADAGRKKLTAMVLGSDQERALRQAATAAVQATADEMSPSGGEQAGQLAMVISEVFREADARCAAGRAGGRCWRGCRQG